MSDRLFAGAWLAAIAFIAWITWQIEVPFSYEPIGPRAFPWMLCIVMALCAVRLLVRPGQEPAWPSGSLLSKSALLLAAMIVYAFTFEWIGFPLATIAVSVAVGRSFGGSWRGVAVTGVALGIGLWYFFDRLLEVTLPLGTLWS